MINNTQRNRYLKRNSTWLIVAGVLICVSILGYLSSPLVLFLLFVAIGGLFIVYQPILGLIALVPVALLSPIEFGTGTEVSLNASTIMIPALVGVWVLRSWQKRQFFLVSSPVFLPLVLFIAYMLLSIFIGYIFWDSLVPRPDRFLLVQLAQWAIYAFSGLACWLTANLVKDEYWLKRLTLSFIALSGVITILMVLPGFSTSIVKASTEAVTRAVFWVVVSGVAGGQLLFNRRLAVPWRIFLFFIVISTFVYALILQREGASNWVGIGVVWAILVWLRWPTLRLPAILVTLFLIASGLLFPTVWAFAGGDIEWQTSGAPRLVLIGRVLEDTLRNPITGLGAAAYRLYGATRPLGYGRAFWFTPSVISHNNYIDIFSFGGIIGLGLFAWLVVSFTRLGFRLRRKLVEGFSSGYVNGLLAVGAGSLAIMMLADWILPFVYNIGFPGFQASLLLWLFLGGLIFLENNLN